MMVKKIFTILQWKKLFIYTCVDGQKVSIISVAEYGFEIINSANPD